MPSAGLRFLAVLLLSLAAGPKRVVVNGQEMEASAADQVGRRDLDAVRAQAPGLAPAEAAARYDAVASRYAGVDVAADALFEAARKWREAGQPDRAAADLRRLVID